MNNGNIYHTYIQLSAYNIWNYKPKVRKPMENYTSLSLETHLFFARIMKEHALFLEAGFPSINEDWIEKADRFREEFEDLLRSVVRLSDGRVSSHILNSDELVTGFTIPAEERTEKLSGIQIDCGISKLQHELNSGYMRNDSRDIMRAVHLINVRSLKLLNGLIEFKENILEEVGNGRLFNANYPLLIQHILREAKMYRDCVEQIMRNSQISYKNLRSTELFWNQIMMEHAMFIRGLLDPCECELIETAEDFTREYCELLEMADRQDARVLAELKDKSLATTIEYSKFKAAGTKGILDCSISSVILPLLADHVLREANHYIRLLNTF